MREAGPRARSRLESRDIAFLPGRTIYRDAVDLVVPVEDPKLLRSDDNRHVRPVTTTGERKRHWIFGDFKSLGLHDVADVNQRPPYSTFFVDDEILGLHPLGVLLGAEGRTPEINDLGTRRLARELHRALHPAARFRIFWSQWFLVRRSRSSRAPGWGGFGDSRGTARLDQAAPIVAGQTIRRCPRELRSGRSICSG